MTCEELAQAISAEQDSGRKLQLMQQFYDQECDASLLTSGPKNPPPPPPEG